MEIDRKGQTLCLWTSIAYVVILGTGCVLAHILPPPSPHNSAQHIANLYRDHTDQIRIGQLIVMIGAALQIPFIGLTTMQLKRISNGRSTALTYTQMLAGATTVLVITMPVMTAAAAAFRPERDPQLMLLISDLMLIPIIMVFPPTSVQCFAIGISILLDKRERPIFPRWVGYYNLWAAVLFFPAGLVLFFKHGAFAWNGLVTLWIPTAVFFTWFVVMFVVLRRGIAEQFADAPPDSPDVARSSAEPAALA